MPEPKSMSIALAGLSLYIITRSFKMNAKQIEILKDNCGNLAVVAALLLKLKIDLKMAVLPNESARVSELVTQIIDAAEAINNVVDEYIPKQLFENYVVTPQQTPVYQ